MMLKKLIRNQLLQILETVEGAECLCGHILKVHTKEPPYYCNVGLMERDCKCPSFVEECECNEVE